MHFRNCFVLEPVRSVAGRAGLQPWAVGALLRAMADSLEARFNPVAVQGEISSLVIQALKTLGQNQINEETLKRILELLQKEKKEHIVHDAKLSPAWIYKILMNALK